MSSRMTDQERFRRDMKRAFIQVCPRWKDGKLLGVGVITNEHQTAEDILQATKANLGMYRIDSRWMLYPINRNAKRASRSG